MVVRWLYKRIVNNLLETVNLEIFCGSLQNLTQFFLANHKQNWRRGKTLHYLSKYTGHILIRHSLLFSGGQICSKWPKLPFDLPSGKTRVRKVKLFPSNNFITSTSGVKLVLKNAQLKCQFFLLFCRYLCMLGLKDHD